MAKTVEDYTSRVVTSPIILAPLAPDDISEGGKRWRQEAKRGGEICHDAQELGSV
jgi:hypothetical protein